MRCYVWHRDITSHPHLAGSAQSEALARELAQFWRELNLDQVNLTPYNILVSKPNISDPNTIQFVDERGNVVFTSAPVERTLTQEDNIDEAVPPFTGFSPAGTVEVSTCAVKISSTHVLKIWRCPIIRGALKVQHQNKHDSGSKGQILVHLFDLDRNVNCHTL